MTPGLGQHTETARVLGLPMGTYEGMSMQQALELPGCRIKLWPLQNAALAAIRHAGGGFLPIGVGRGKAMIACLAGAALGAELAVLLAPAATLRQLTRTFFTVRDNFKTSKTTIKSIESLQRPTDGCWITKWVEEECGVTDWSKVVLVIDEAHALKNLHAARTRRFLRAVKEHPEVKVVAMSGTLIQKSLRDCAHLADMTLRAGAPMPRGGHELETWCDGIDVRGEPSRAIDWLLPTLWNWYAGQSIAMPGMTEGELRTAFRKAFRKRLETTPGVVASAEDDLGTSLLVRLRRDLQVPSEVHQALNTLRTSGKMPDGEIILPDKSDFTKDERQLAQGFFYTWVWPNNTPDEDWLRARAWWNSVVREELENAAAPGYDSPLLVWNHWAKAVAEGKGGTQGAAWQAWNTQRHKDPPPRRVVWLSRYVVEFVIKWVRSHKEPVIVWYEHQAMAEALREAGIPVYGAGELAPVDNPHTCALSTHVHDTGLDLQHGWSKQLIISAPHKAKKMQQLLGRTHRHGQQADTVEVDILYHVPALHRAFGQVLEEAKLAQEVDFAQKILLADIEGDLEP